MKTPDYLSYDRYKKKKKDTSKKGMMLAITTFFATLLIFTAVAKMLSPDVDVTIGGDSETDAKETGLGVKRFIDDRLRAIQMDDNSNSSKTEEKQKTSLYDDTGFDTYSKQVEEKVVVPSQKGGTQEAVQEEPIASTRTAPPRPSSSKDLSTPFEAPRMTKVYVGRYSTIEQAKVAQEILLDSGVDITPFVKNMGGYYTLQVGSFSSRAKASEIAGELQQNNFPARMVQD